MVHPPSSICAEAIAECARILDRRVAGFRARGWSDDSPLIVENIANAREMRALAASPPSNSRTTDDLRSIEERKHLRSVFERDRSIVATALTGIKKAIRAHEWLRLGRGSYEYNDERWRDEFGAAIDGIESALEPLKTLAGDWSDCPTDRAEIIAARSLPSLTELEQDSGVSALTKENERLRKALTPLADIPLGGEIIEESDLVLYHNGGKAITVGDVLAAQVALRGDSTMTALSVYEVQSKRIAQLEEALDSARAVLRCAADRGRRFDDAGTLVLSMDKECAAISAILSKVEEKMK